jgi:hypothetical protein
MSALQIKQQSVGSSPESQLTSFMDTVDGLQLNHYACAGCQAFARYFFLGTKNGPRLARTSHIHQLFWAVRVAHSRVLLSCLAQE